MYHIPMPLVRYFQNLRRFSKYSSPSIKELQTIWLLFLRAEWKYVLTYTVHTNRVYTIRKDMSSGATLFTNAHHTIYTFAHMIEGYTVHTYIGYTVNTRLIVRTVPHMWSGATLYVHMLGATLYVYMSRGYTVCTSHCLHCSHMRSGVYAVREHTHTHTYDHGIHCCLIESAL